MSLIAATVATLGDLAKSALRTTGFADDLDNRVRVRPVTSYTEEETPGIALHSFGVTPIKLYGAAAAAIRGTASVVVSQGYRRINDPRDAVDTWLLAWEITTALRNGLAKSFRGQTVAANYDGVIIDRIDEQQGADDPFSARIDIAFTINARVSDTNPL